MMEPYTASIMMGLFRAMKLSAFTNRRYTLAAALANFSFSYFSRTKAFTTRMAETFSCTLALRAS